MNMSVMKHKCFQDQDARFFLSISRSKSHERVREAAESFINSIGAEKVVSVTQDYFTSLVTVWYREEGDSLPSKDVMHEV